MFSGKTEELIRRLRRAKIAEMKVEVFKPKVDTRYDEIAIVSHDTTSVLAQAILPKYWKSARIPPLLV
jgi:thymidine kinase